MGVVAVVAILVVGVVEALLVVAGTVADITELEQQWDIAVVIGSTTAALVMPIEIAKGYPRGKYCFKKIALF